MFSEERDGMLFTFEVDIRVYVPMSELDLSINFDPVFS